MLSLCAAQTTNVAGATTRVRNPDVTDATVVVWGTMGGATVTVQLSPDVGTTWVDFPVPITTTTAKSFQISLPAGIDVRSNITGGAAASISVAIFE
jgi:hypothetical protein